MLAAAIRKISEKQDLTREETYRSVGEIFRGQASEAQIAAFLTGLKVKGETIEEMTGGLRSLLDAACMLSPRVAGGVDIVGTGGDGTGTFNISSAAALVAAGAGARVVKHGNRSVSSRSGSADLFEALGICLTLSPQEAERCLDTTGLVFLYAPSFHPAMRHAASVRRQLGFRSLFNLLGPLANPARPGSMLLGVCDRSLLDFMAETLREMGMSRALVVYGLDGTDEISLTAPTDCRLLDQGKIRPVTLAPGQFGLPQADLAELAGGTASENAGQVEKILDGMSGAPRDVVLLNAAAALFVTGQAGSIHEGLQMAQTSVDSGAAKSKLQALRRFCQQIQGG
jgi:anthranilate phosphoribosyltransferase